MIPTQTLTNINNSLLSVGTGSWAFSFLEGLDLILGVVLHMTGILTFVIFVVLNRRKIIRELRIMFNNCPVDEEEKG